MEDKRKKKGWIPLTIQQEENLIKALSIPRTHRVGKKRYRLCGIGMNVYTRNAICENLEQFGWSHSTIAHGPAPPVWAIYTDMPRPRK